MHVYSNVRIAASMQRKDLGHASTGVDSSLETALRIRHIPEESKGVEKVRLAGCVRPHDEDAPLKGHINAQEVFPVLESDASKVQESPWHAALILRLYE